MKIRFQLGRIFLLHKFGIPNSQFWIFLYLGDDIIYPNFQTENQYNNQYSGKLVVRH